MSRYIDAERFDVIAYETKGKEEWTDFDDGVSFMLNKIDNAPTADVAPVVHGRWVQGEYEWESDYWTCSVCKEEYHYDFDPTEPITKVNYCPNCGAKMDGEAT